MPEPLLQEPAAIFLTIMAVIFIAPLLSERARLPGIVGLILGGILIGAHVLNLLSVGPVIELFGVIGLIYLMFNAGLEIDLDQFQSVRRRAFVFAALSYALPQISGVVIGRIFGLDWAASILLGSIYASQTLVAYPVLTRLGIIRNEAVSITIGATVFTDIASLLVLAVIVGSQEQSFSFGFLGQLVLLTAVYAVLILFGLPRLGRYFFKRFSGRALEFQFVLVVLFLAAVLAEQIGMHTIVGAFLAGLAINQTLSRESRVVGQVLFLGESLFVPMFLISVGMRLDPAAILVNRETLLIGLSLTAAVLITKFIAAWITSRLYGYSRDQMLTAWGLSQAQAAATLAAILVGQEAGIFQENIFNAAILMILVTSIASPILVERFGKRLKPPDEAEEKRPLLKRIMVPVIDDELPEDLLELGALLSRVGEGKLLVMNMASGDNALKMRREKLKSDVIIDPETDVDLRDRIEEHGPHGILKEAVESEASLILMDWSDGERMDGRLLDEVVDGVLWEAKVPVFAVRFAMALKALERVVLVVAAQTVGVKFDQRTLEAALEIAKSLDLPFVVMATDHYIDGMRAGVDNEPAEKHRQVVTLGGDVVEFLSGEIEESDMVLLPSMGSQARFEADSGHLPAKLLERLDSSMAIIHFP